MDVLQRLDQEHEEKQRLVHSYLNIFRNLKLRICLVKKYQFDENKIQKWLKCGVQPSETVLNLLKKADILVSN